MAYSDSWRTAFGSPFSARLPYAGSGPAGYWSLFNKKKQRPMTRHETLLDSFISGGRADVGNYPGTYTTMPEFSSDPMKKLSPPFSLGVGGEFGADQGGAGVGLSGTGRWGSGLAKKGPDYESMMEALGELQFAQETFKSLGKAGGAGGGKFQVAANPFMSHAMMAPSGGASPEEKKRRERYWAMQGLLA